MTFFLFGISIGTTSYVSRNRRGISLVVCKQFALVGTITRRVTLSHRRVVVQD